MFLEIFITLLLGALAGIITGITPGIHINLVSILLLSLSPVLLNFTSPLSLVVFIISMGVMHTFVDSIPSIFLGSPDDDTALNVLPGHKMLLLGQGYEAVKLTVIGSLLGLYIIILISPLLLISISKIYSVISKFIPYILIVSVIFLIFRNKKAIYWSFVVFSLSGVFGLAVFNLNFLKQPLFPLLSGLFGISTLIISAKDNTKVPEQKISTPSLDKKGLIKTLFGGTLASLFTGFLPGMGAAQAAIIASSIIGRVGTKLFLVLIGSINTMVMIVSFIALYSIEKARNGAVVVISKIIPSITMYHLLFFLGVILVVGFLGTFITLIIAKKFSVVIGKVNYRKLCLFIIMLITVLVGILSGPIGILVLITSTFVGLIPIVKGVNRSLSMGCLILPVILYFLL